MHVIAFEGIDNAGKTTQCLELAERLRHDGHLVAITFEQPSVIHKLIKSCFQRGEFSPHLKTILSAAELFDHWCFHLSKADVAIFDRYIYSLLAYGLMESVDRAWIESMIVPLPRANNVIYLDIPVESYQDRIRGRDEYVSPYAINSLVTVRNNYLTLAEEAGFFSIDGTKKETEIAELVYRQVSVSLGKTGL